LREFVRRKVSAIFDIYEYLHAHPEISWEEKRTTEYLAKIFSREQRCRVIRFNEITGLMVEIGSGKPVIALRADMDALWQEIDGTFRANHSCGHDAHMTIACGVILTLLEMENLPSATYRFLFQPAEEVGEGALAFINKGLVDDVDLLFGLHLRPAEELRDGTFSPAIRHSAALAMEGFISGRDAHGARPHLNVNAIEVGMAFVQMLNQIHLNPQIPYSAKMTAFHAGGKNSNIIPGNARFFLDLRAQNNGTMEELSERVKQIAQTLSHFHRVDIDLSVRSQIPAAVLNEVAIGILSEAIMDSVGRENLAPAVESPGGEDFHFYSFKRPHLKATMLGVGCGLTPGLHHPEMRFNLDAIPKAVEILTRALVKAANSLDKRSVPVGKHPGEKT